MAGQLNNSRKGCNPGLPPNSSNGNWTTRGYANSRIMPTRGLDISWTGQLPDWTTRGLADAVKKDKNSSGDEIANVNFCTTTTYMERPAPTPIEPLLSTINIYGT